MKKILVQYLYIVVIVACVFVLAGCANKPQSNKSDPMSVIKNAESLGKALGCIFGCGKSQQSPVEESK